MLIRQVWLGLGLCTAAAAAEPGIGSWLIDLGRDYPLSAQAGLSDADATLTLLFMEAATRLEPDLSEGYYWQYDMLTALDRPDDARRALAAYVRREPADAAAQLNWIDAAVNTLQTAEQRAEFCAAYLRRENLPAPAVSELHGRLAEYCWNRAEMDRAAQEARAALAADAFNLRMRQLLAETKKTASDPVTAVEHYLWLLRINPASVQVAGDLARLLATAGELGESERFLAHATRLAEMVPPGHAPIGLVVQRAEVLADAGRLDDAQKLIDEAIQREPDDVDAQFARARLAGRSGDQVTARAAVAQVSQVWKQRLSAGQGGLHPAEFAELSWILVHVLGDADQAAKLARSLLVEPEAKLVAHRALGAALLRQGRSAEALEELAVAVGRDNWSAILLTEAMQKLGKTADAAKQVAVLATQPASGDQRQRIAELARQLNTTVPATQPHTRLAHVLEQFPAEVLDFPFKPEKYLSAAWSIEPASPTGSEPWLCTLTLRNTGSFPIVIGRDAMLSPEILCSIQSLGDKPRSSGPSLRVLLSGPLQLQPDESMRVARNLLIGPIRAGMIGTPQVTQQVELTSVTNPMRLVDPEGRDVWAPAPGGLVPAVLKFERRGIVAVPNEVRRLVMASSSGDVDQRIQATTKLAMLLAEHQHLAARRLNYEVPRIDAAMVQQAVLARAADSDWGVRARFTEMSRWFMLDKPASQTVTQLLGDPHWLVRGLAARSLADHYGEKFRMALERLSTSDADGWVRRLCAALLQRGRTQAVTQTQPSASILRPPGDSTFLGAAATRPAQSASPREPLLLALPEEPLTTHPAPGR